MIGTCPTLEQISASGAVKRKPLTGSGHWFRWYLDKTLEDYLVVGICHDLGERMNVNGASSLRLLILRPLTLDARKLTEGNGGAAKTDAEPRQVLDSVVGAFAAGYNAALTTSRGALELPQVPRDLRGFAYEGAAMSRTILDLVTLSRGRRIGGLADGTGRDYIHLIHVGAGWAFARLRLSPWRAVRFGDPMLRWLAWDGWGFHQAYFHPRAVVLEGRVERAARGPVREIRDQGVGRALWFHASADPARIGRVIGTFSPDRRSDLWAGIGLAASYTGAQPPERLAELLRGADGYHDHLAQGSAFAAKAHLQAGHMPAGSATAIEMLTGADPLTAASWTDTSLAVAGRSGAGPENYELWRAGVRRAWARQKGGVRS